MQQIVLDGIPPSKKNSKRIVRRGNRTMLLSQAGYDAWERSTALQMAALLRPVQRANVSIIFGFADRRRRDLTNAAEGVMDALVRAAILPDDSWQHVPRLCLDCVISGKAHTTITIVSLD